MTRHTPARSLAATLALSFVAMSSVLLVVSGGIQLATRLRTEQDAVASRQLLVAEDAARAVSTYVLDRFTVLETAVWVVDPGALDVAANRTLLQGLLGLQPPFSRLALFGPDGRELVRVTRLPLEEFDRATFRFAAEALAAVARDSRYVSPVAVDAVTNEPSVTLAVPVFSALRERHGTLVAELNLKFMWDLVGRLRVGRAGHAYVVNRRGDLIGAGDPARVLRGQNVARLTPVGEFVRGLARGRAAGVRTYIGLDGAWVVGTLAALEMPDWAVVTELPWTEAYRDFIRELAIGIVAFLVMTALAGLVGVRLARRLSVPVVDLMNTAARIAVGDRELQAEVRGPKEVASLAAAFNSMTDQLRGSLAGLERQVAEIRRAEEALRESEQRYRTLADAAFEGIAVTRQGTIVDANDQFAAMFGYSREELVGLAVDQLVAPEHRELVRSAIASGGLGPYEHTAVRKDGSTLSVEIRARVAGAAASTTRIAAIRDISARKRAEKALQELSQRDREALQVAQMGHWEFDVASGLFTFNDQYYALHGMTADEAGGYQMTAEVFEAKYVAPEDRGLVERTIQAAIQSPDAGFEYRAETGVIRRDGERRNVAVWFRVEKDDAGRAVRLHGVNLDITERKRAERDLLEKTLELESYFQDALDLLCIADTDGYFRRLNKEWETTLGYSIAELEGRRFLDFVHPDDLEATIRAVEALGRQTNLLNFVNRYRASDGSYRWIEWRSFPAGRKIYAAARDITERRRAEEALRQSEFFLRRSQEVGDLGSFYFDVRAGTWISSQKLDEIFGLGASARKDTDSWLGVVHGDDRESMRTYLRDHVVACGRRFDREYRIIRASDGQERWVHGLGELEFDDGGNATAMIGTVQDITSRRRAEDEIRHLNERLEERVARRTAELEAANRELEAFAYSVSHDLRAPLRAIDGYTRILTEDHQEALGEAGRRACAVVRGETQRMGRLIDDLLDFSRLGRTPLRHETLDMGRLADSVFSELTTAAARDRIDLRIADLPAAVGDPALLRQVWTNLLSNAIKFSSKRDRAAVSIEGWREAGQVTYVVRDNGAGFDPTYAAKLFGVFQRLHTSREFEGTGVGLAIVQRIVQRHGGRAWAEGEPGAGASFYFSLPESGTGPAGYGA